MAEMFENPDFKVEGATGISDELEKEGFRLLEGKLVVPPEWVECDAEESAKHRSAEIRGGVVATYFAKYQKTYEIAPFFPRLGVMWVSIHFCEGRFSGFFSALK
jgi:hypothetical protein